MLRCLRLAILCVVCWWTTGCQFAKTASSAASSKSTAPAQERSDAVKLSTVFIERPLGDPFLNKDIEDESAPKICVWSSTDHHLDNMEREILLEENGFRVGQMGMVPGKMLTLLASETACVNPYTRFFPFGEPTPIHLGPPCDRGVFQIRNAGQTQSFTFEQARYCLDVVARPSKDGRVQLELTPKVEHRPGKFAVTMDDNLTGLVNQVTPPQKGFPLLTWNVALKPGETLVIGANLEKPGSLGYRSFVDEDAPEPVQRVLVLRATGPVED